MIIQPQVSRFAGLNDVEMKLTN